MMIVLVQASYFIYSAIIDVSSLLTSGVINLMDRHFFMLTADNIINIGLQFFFAVCYVIVLLIAVSYLEGNQQYREGESSNGKSKIFLNSAMERIFPNLDKDIITLFIKNVRHGFFHDGITRKDIMINGNSPKVIEKKDEILLINPHTFLKKIINDCNEYITELKKEGDESSKFETYLKVYSFIQIKFQRR